MTNSHIKSYLNHLETSFGFAFWIVKDVIDQTEIIIKVRKANPNLTDR